MVCSVDLQADDMDPRAPSPSQLNIFSAVQQLQGIQCVRAVMMCHEGLQCLIDSRERFSEKLAQGKFSGRRRKQFCIAVIGSLIFHVIVEFLHWHCLITCGEICFNYFSEVYLQPWFPSSCWF